MKRLIAGGVAVIAALVLAPMASASTFHPTGEFEQFGECPLSIETLENCVYSVSNGGNFTIGTKSVPLKNPVILQGGFSGAGEEIQFFGAANGETLSKTAQPVPGGLLGVVAPTWWPAAVQEWFNNLINDGFTGVTATVELAAPATSIKLSTGNLISRTGTALGLPVKVKLSNAILGSNCYLGSNSHPVQINFTTGNDGALEGRVGTVKFNKTFSLITISGGLLVNNSFEAPGVSGCGGIFSFLVDPLVDSILGVPAGAGQNSATLEGTLQTAVASAVKASE